MWLYMAIINEMIYGKEEAETEIVDKPSSILGELTNLLREINQLLQNPAIAKYFMKNVNPSPIQNQVMASPEPKQEIDFKQILLEMLQNPEKKKQLVDGINELIKYVGDIKLSELAKQLEQLDLSKLGIGEKKDGANN